MIVLPLISLDIGWGSDGASCEADLPNILREFKLIEPLEGARKGLLEELSSHRERLSF
jgi:hypothetical protein